MPAISDHYWLPTDLAQFPDGDGKKYECIDGVLLVTPAPRVVHMAALVRLQRILDRAGAKHRAIIATADLLLAPESVVQPDLFVLREPATGKLRLDDPACTVLIVEVLSPSTAKYDRGLKRLFYQRVGVPDYWIVDLDARLIERWKPADERPEILRERLTWRDPVTGVELVLEVPRYFADVWGNEPPAE